MARKKQVAKPARPAATAETDRVTYRDLRNTPGRVWERLANDEPLTLVAEGETKAIIIPVADGDPREALEAYRRGAALMAVARMRKRARESGTAKLTLPDINALINEVRRERARGTKRGRGA